MTEIQLFPTVNWWIYSLELTHIKINECQKYERAKFNRYPVAGSNGVIQLSVPLKGGRNQKQPLNEVRIANEEGWQMRHWRTLFSCYNKSPYFEYYKESLEAFIFRKHETLFALDLASVHWILDQLKMKVNIELVEDDHNAIPSGSCQNGIYYYPQVFEDRIGFQPDLSVLDLLFNLGPSAREWLLRQNEKRNK